MKFDIAVEIANGVAENALDEAIETADGDAENALDKAVETAGCVAVETANGMTSDGVVMGTAFEHAVDYAVESTASEDFTTSYMMEGVVTCIMYIFS